MATREERIEAKLGRLSGGMMTARDRDAIIQQIPVWLDAAQQIADQRTFTDSFGHLHTVVLSAAIGRRYARIVAKDYYDGAPLSQRYARIVAKDYYDGAPLSHTDSAFAFVDLTNGDVLEPASWQRPAKHARGNIFDNTKPGVSAWGALYIRR